MEVKSKIKPLEFSESRLTKEYWSTLSKLNTPKKIQNFINIFPFNFETEGATHMSVSRSLQEGKMHCFEGALVAASALWAQGQKPLLLDLVAKRPDDDHVVALFESEGFWGAISKTNHSILRYREPVYRDIHELAMSYFHEYFLSDGSKTMRSYSKPFDLSKQGFDWLTSEEDLFDLAGELDDSLHYQVLTPKQVKGLRKADDIERLTTEVVEWKKKE